MRPIRPTDDKANHTAGDPELVGDRLMRQPLGRVNLSDRQNFVLSQFDHAMPPSFWVGPMNFLVSLILAVCHPSKITGSIIQWIAISMSCLMSCRRTWTMERRADQYVDIDRRDFSEGHPMVANSSEARLQHNATLKPAPSVFVNKRAVQRPHTPQARRLIAWMSRHWTPLFRFGYRTFSHIALLQRRGQGMTEGSNQPSFPLYNGSRTSANAITVLCARV